MSDIVERLLEPDRHDPECPFKNHCYCDGAHHDTVSHPLAAESAEAILALRKEAADANMTILSLRKEVERLNSRLAGVSRATNEAGAKLQAIARTVDSPAALATEAE